VRPLPHPVADECQTLADGFANGVGDAEVAWTLGDDRARLVDEERIAAGRTVQRAPHRARAIGQSSKSKTS
jgi:hypothetical protein